MRIVVVTTSYPLFEGDPSGHFVRSEVLELLNAGHEVTVLAPHPRPHQLSGPPRVCFMPGGSAFGWPGARSRIAAWPPRAAWVGVFVLACCRYLARHPCDLVIAHWLLPSGIPIASSTATPSEIVVHGSDARWLCTWPRWLRSLVFRQLRRQGSRLRFVSQQLRDELLGALDAPLDLPTTVRPCVLHTKAADRTSARAALGVEPEARLALVVGRLLASKRIDLALSADMPAHQWVVIGDGPEAARLRSRHSGVRFLGRLPHDLTLLWLSAADVLVSASLLEGSPTVVREARQLGTRVLAAPAGDLVDWAAHDPGIQINWSWAPERS